jgi:hypothetical protein
MAILHMDITIGKDKAVKIKFKNGTVNVLGANLTIINNREEKEKKLFGPGEYEVAGVSVIGYPGLYIFESDEMRVGVVYGDVQSNEIGEINVLLVPVTGATDLVRKIEPNIVIPLECMETSELTSFVKEIGLTVEHLPKLSMKITDFGETEKIVVLACR